ncbi:MAG: ribonuclease H [Flavobacteriales endosymbiont of Rhyzopertha dominica]|nr:MAG: ribonuclease HI [Candidatus Shikimatogenerans bostrichidophilus]
MNNNIVNSKIYILYIDIYTDGSSKGNPGFGGAAIIIISYNYYKEKLLKYRFTTNNRIELYAIIEAIKTIKIYNFFIVNIYIDSKYILYNINKIKNNKRIIKNEDLWNKIKLIIIKENKIIFFWIKGHNNNYYNEKCHLLSIKRVKNIKILIDKYYEKYIFKKN